MSLKARILNLGVLLLLVAGCPYGGGHLKFADVTRTPAFYNPELKRVAVVPFTSQVEDKDAGERISQRLETALIQNGCYEVYTRQHLKAVLDEQDLAASGIVSSETAQRFGKLGSVQAIICGVCQQYASGSVSEQRTMQIPQFGRLPNGNFGITGYQTQEYIWTRNEAAVQCNAVVIDTATGRQIAAVNELSRGHSEGSPPRYSQWDTLQLMESDQVFRVLRGVAVTQTKIKLKGDPVRPATCQYDAKWEWQNEYLPGDEFQVVVTLPPEASRNAFQLVIVCGDEKSRKIVAQDAFIWRGEDDNRGFKFSLAPLAEQYGYGLYTAKLYSCPQNQSNTSGDEAVPRGDHPTPFTVSSRQPCIAWYTFGIIEKR